MTEQQREKDWLIWQDRTIIFDAVPDDLKCKKNEQIVQKMNQIEDSKGNENDTGTMIITNLRFIWYLEKNPKVNLSVGYDAITKVEINNSYSAENGNA